eukprot:CAMPEP_0202003208 /NCGR_PEP_ID=MMETSP0905-20130828/8844_1 /ASSEMBLY_ACC=CAM_ASM_000554 /TAXON_ID=420261 /ORGANISM="Thalassiosira antarctica, Strain CCMP982" /LENGTH=171 /DNA_ID=CAMNT_0048560299 /DNA_START=206 /DNA_END=724 /DNA_ORIENTATION=+
MVDDIGADNPLFAVVGPPPVGGISYASNDASSVTIGGLGTAKTAKTLPDNDDEGDASARRGIASPLHKNRIEILPPCSSKLSWASIFIWEVNTIHVPFLDKRKGGRPLVHVVVAMVHMNVAVVAVVDFGGRWSIGRCGAKWGQAGHPSCLSNDVPWIMVQSYSETAALPPR